MYELMTGRFYIEKLSPVVCGGRVYLTKKGKAKGGGLNYYGNI